MKRIGIVLSVMVMLAGLQACSDNEEGAGEGKSSALPMLSIEPTFDSTDTQTRKDSINAILETLPETEKTRFKNTLLGIHFVVIQKAMKTGEDRQAAIDDISAQMHGMNAEDIFAFAKAFHDQHGTLDKIDQHILEAKQKEAERANIDPMQPKNP